MFIKGGLVSLSFDNEGVVCFDMIIVDVGKLVIYFYIIYLLCKLNICLNGYVGGIYNWLVGDMGYSDVDLFKEMGIGLFVIELMG